MVFFVIIGQSTNQEEVPSLTMADIIRVKKKKRGIQVDGKNEGTCRQAKRQKQTSMDILWHRADNYLPSGWTEWWAWTTECPGKTCLKECLASWDVENTVCQN